MRILHSLLRVAPVLLLPVLGGCAYFSAQPSSQQLDGGLAIVLPGIEGPSVFNSNVAMGLAEANPDIAVEVHDWTTGWFPLMLYHLRSKDRNREQARSLAKRIVRYQDAYPGRPVYLIGHSGGGGMSLLTLEALPPDRRVDSVLLLAAAISHDYDLRAALSRTERGVWNFSSPGDWQLLVVGTTVAGTIDGRHVPSAGAYGFRLPPDLTGEDRRLYREKLHEVPYQFSMMTSGNLGGHFGPTTKSFSRDYLAPLMMPDYRSALTNEFANNRPDF